MRAVALAILLAIALAACTRAAGREPADRYWKDKDDFPPKVLGDAGTEAIDLWVEPDGDVCTPGAGDAGLVDGC